jgi:hypothetical protein
MAIPIFSQKSDRFRLRDAYGVTGPPSRCLRRDRVGSEGMR